MKKFGPRIENWTSNINAHNHNDNYIEIHECIHNCNIEIYKGD